MKRKQDMYTRYVIKSIVSFIIFLFVGVILFLFLSLTIEIETVKTYKGYYDENKVIINEKIDDELYELDEVYVYKSRGKKLYKFTVAEKTYIDEYTMLDLESEKTVDAVLDGNISIDVITERNSLLSIILGFKKKYITDEYS